MTTDRFRETNFLSTCFCAITLMLAFALASSPAQADPQSKYRAFYYDAQSRLLQVEEVPDGEFGTRKTVDINDSVMPVPMLTERSVPLISGANIPMSRFAVLAVYYTYDQGAPTPSPGAADVPGLPDSVEYLGFVKERTIAACAALTSTDPCKFPQRCHCMTATCCCY